MSLRAVIFKFPDHDSIFCKIFTVDMSYAVAVKSTGEISQNFGAFSEFINLTIKWVKLNEFRVRLIIIKQL